MTDKKELIDESLNPDDCTYCGRCAKFAKHIGNEGDSGDLYVVTSYQNFKKFMTEHVEVSKHNQEYLYGRGAEGIFDNYFNVPLSEIDFFMLCRLLRIADKNKATESSVCDVIENLLGVETWLSLEDAGCLEICFAKSKPHWVYRVKFQNFKEYFTEYAIDEESTLWEIGFFNSLFGKKEVRDETLDELYLKIHFGLERMTDSLRLDLSNACGNLSDSDFNTDALRHITDFCAIAEICLNAFEEARYGGKKWQKRRLEQIKQSWKQFDSTADKRETENENS